MLRPLQGIFGSQDFPNLLAGLEAPDDAAVWRLDDERALVITTDFFTPVVDDPYDYGYIAAANSLSDVYAMGGEPFLALNIACLPPQLPAEIASEILHGGADLARLAGIAIVGGHTIQDKEPKYGLVAVGLVHPQKMLTKGGAKPGDRLVLTKPIGSGLIASAIKADMAPPEHAAEAIGWMKQLNRQAARLASEFGVHAATDITGFSLLGHACEMAAASGVRLQFQLDHIPLMSGLDDLMKRWAFPGGSYDNSEYFQPQVAFDPDITQETQLLLFDPQTSGGLLIALPQEPCRALLAKAALTGQPAWEVGFVEQGRGIVVTTKSS